MTVSIPERFKKLRKEKKLSQLQVANTIGLSRSAYCRIENGTSNSWACYLDPLCKLFEIELPNLFDEKATLKANISNKITDTFLKELTTQYEKRLLEKDRYIKKLEFELKKNNPQKQFLKKA